MRLQAQVHDLVEMRVVDVREHAEHLLVDPLHFFVEVRREAVVFADPGVCRGVLGRGRRGGEHDGLCGEEGLVVELGVDPGEDALDVVGGRHADGLHVVVGVEPGEFGTGVGVSWVKAESG